MPVPERECGSGRKGSSGRKLMTPGYAMARTLMNPGYAMARIVWRLDVP